MVNDCPAGLEPPAWDRNWKKATVKIRRNMAPIDPYDLLYVSKQGYLKCLGGSFKQWMQCKL